MFALNFQQKDKKNLMQIMLHLIKLLADKIHWQKILLLVKSCQHHLQFDNKNWQQKSIKVSFDFCR